MFVQERRKNMARVVSTGRQDFALMMKNKNFYVDKTKFIEEWWNDDKDVTLVTRPRRFGKTLMMSTVNCFFSNRYAGRKDLFKGLYIRKRRKMMGLQGTYPVVFLSFSDCKDSEDVNGRSIKGYNDMVRAIKEEISDLYGEFPEILGSNGISEAEKRKFVRIRDFEDEKQFTTAMMTDSIQFLCKLISRVSDNKPIIILDEYDTPLQEAYTSGYWPRLVKTMRAFFNKSFKTTKHFEKALVTGITRVSKESLFSDVNNFNTYSVTSDRYADCFGFTEQEVFDSLDEYGLSEKKRQVKNWYDGFVFGNLREIYNPYSIASLLNEKKFKTYWADTSSNALVSQLIRYGADGTRDDFLQLMKGDAIRCVINENVVYGTLYEQPGAIWSLLLGSGYLKAEEVMWPGENDVDLDKPIYTLSITNRETRLMFKDMVNAWFTTGTKGKSYDRFIEALLSYNIEGMNIFLNEVSLNSFSYFCTDNSSPESFWQGFIVGLLVRLQDDYILTCNRIAGYGIYDIQLKPREKSMQAFVIEVKNIDATKKAVLESDAPLKKGVKDALGQIEDNKYYTELVSEGYPVIRKLGLAFRGQKCLIGDAESIENE